ncbi:MAG: ImmA/IrrE family metallo-endopeptidase [Flavobacterium sp.]|nr:MAG: ImmA/IrrE family metallo-endopeptidase [Flavobacterium sp.]
MNPLFKSALLKADQLRRHLGLNMFQPVNIFDVCQELKLTVKFVDVSMEGMYVKQENSAYILLSNQRPLPRRCFTCAHELGHHLFGHGTRLDNITHKADEGHPYDSDELLVDSFAGALLMPIVGIETALVKRKWSIQDISPIEFYTLSSNFGVGYQTLVHHCKTNRLINDSVASRLLKATPQKILRSLFGQSAVNSYFKIIDRESKLTVIDLEVSNYLILPPDVEIEGDHLKLRQLTTEGTAYEAIKPGIVRAASADGSISSFVRIQNFQYEGLAEYRHLENIID